MERFGERIRELRKDRGLTLSELSMRLGISRNTLTSWELGEKEPYAIGRLREIAEVLRVPVSSLLAGENELRVEDNLKNLEERVTRLERICKNYAR